jgi:Leucine-rich repeat (LRR) protein
MLWLGLVVNLITVLATVPTQEIDFLLNLYLVTKGDSWRWRPEGILFGYKWDFQSVDVNPCKTNWTAWQGIKCTAPPNQCDDIECHIISLDLSLYELKGTLPDHWQDLPYLTFLDLGLNQLEGSFPRTLTSPAVSLQELYLPTNFLSGSLPGEVIANMTSLIRLDLSMNIFSGSFPPEVGSLSRLEYLGLRHFQATGGLPSAIGNLALLTKLDLSNCALTGTVPLEIGNLLSMKYIDIDFNEFTGTIPPEVGSLQSMTFFDLSSNHLTGPLPSTIGSFSLMTTLNFDYNHFTNSIPSTIGSISLLVDLFLADNLLTAPLPSSINNLKFLTNLDLVSNRLTGEIPSDLSSLTRLSVLNLGGNRLFGTIPMTIGDLSTVSWLNLMMNSLTGTIPTQIGQLKFLKYFYINDNLLSGPLVCSVTQFLSLVLLDYQLNSFTGPLCPTFSVTITDLRLDSNLLTGTIPSGFGFLKNLGFLQLGHNHLTGRIPSEVENMTALYSLSLSYNHLSHCLPTELGSILSLKQIYLNSNSIHCGLEEILFQPSQLNWVNLDISDNVLSGSIPKQLFQINSLTTIVLTSNCFGGLIPRDICLNRNLQVISFDGLGASHLCPRSDFLSLQRDRLLDGSIPICLWSLLNLSSISLSGNGLTGTLGDIPSRSKLQNVTLSHNQLSGTIPKSFQLHPFQLLDLSYNRFIGEIDDLTANPNESKSQFILEVNRLSGVLRSFDRWSSSKVKLNMLSGNLFSCSTLPEIDQNYGLYICGSEDLDRAMILFGAISFLVLLTLLLLLILRNTNMVSGSCESLRSSYLVVVSYLRSTASSHSLVLQEYNLLLRRISVIFLFLTVMGILLLVPLYILKSIKRGEGEADGNSYRYRTHTHLYRWLWTVAYSTGQIPAGFILCAWGVLASLFVFSFQAIDTQNSSTSHPNRKTWSQPTTRVILLLCADILIVGGINAGYIYSTTQNINSSTQLVIKALLAVFTFLWSEGLSRSSHVVLTISFTIIKTIVIPCLATALTSTSCFQVSSPHRIFFSSLPFLSIPDSVDPASSDHHLLRLPLLLHLCHPQWYGLDCCFLFN